MDGFDLDEIKRRYAEASDGEWRYEQEEGLIRSSEQASDHIASLQWQEPYRGTRRNYENARANGEFLAAAHQDVPALIAELERLNGVIRTYYDALSERDEELAAAHENHRQWRALHEENIKLREDELAEFRRWQAETRQARANQD